LLHANPGPDAYAYAIARAERQPDTGSVRLAARESAAGSEREPHTRSLDIAARQPAADSERIADRTAADSHDGTGHSDARAIRSNNSEALTRIKKTPPVSRGRFVSNSS